MINLVKYCKPYYNLLDKCHSIRVGTFQYYRELDPKFYISDPSEGLDVTAISSLSKGKASPEAAAAISPFGFGPYSELTNCRLELTFPNSYVWCCSLIDKPPSSEDGKRFDEGYTSFYIIPNARKFAEYMLSLLMTNISFSNFADSTREQCKELTISELGQISLNVIHRPVLYVDSKLAKIDEGFYRAYAPDLPQALRPIFVKPIKYEEDREYRFVFIFQHPTHGVLAVQKNPVDLPVIPITTGS